MKVLKDADKVLHIMDAKLDEFHKRFAEADGEEAAEISGQAVVGRRAINHPKHPESRRRHQRRRTTASLFTIPPAMTWMRTEIITIHRTAASPRRGLAVARSL